jgi:hypothetical protein
MLVAGFSLKQRASRDEHASPAPNAAFNKVAADA